MTRGHCALVIGGAMGVWDEVEQAKHLCDFDVIVAVKKAGLDYPGRIDHWVTWHPERLLHWIPKRRKEGRPDAGMLWSGKLRGVRQGTHLKLPLNWLTCDGGGSSGLLGTLIALEYADKAVLAGIPMDADREHYDKPGLWNEAPKYHKAWQDELPKLKDRVRSLSGWTQALLGSPDLQWLATQDAAHVDHQARECRAASA